MKVLFVPAKKSVFISDNLIKRLSKKLPRRIAIFSTIQFQDFIKKFSLILKDKQVFISENPVLGCKVTHITKYEDKVDAFLYIGSGNFHPLSLALKLKKEKEIFIFNPNTLQFSEFDWTLVGKIKAREKAARIKFLSSDKIGVLVSIKSGQERLKEALKLKINLEERKRAYLFIFDEFHKEQLENWPNLAWVNTACPGLAQDFCSLNIENL